MNLFIRLKAPLALVLGLMVLFTAGCKVGQMPKNKKELPEGVLSDKEVFKIVSIEFSKFNIRAEPNVRFEDGDVKFKASGFDQNLQIGFVYFPPRAENEGLFDVARRAGAAGNLSPEKEAKLKELEKKSRVYFLILRGGTPDEIAIKAYNFANQLVENGVLKLQKGSVVTTPEQEKAGEALDFEKVKGRQVDPGKMENVDTPPEE